MEEGLHRDSVGRVVCRQPWPQLWGHVGATAWGCGAAQHLGHPLHQSCGAAVPAPEISPSNPSWWVLEPERDCGAKLGAPPSQQPMLCWWGSLQAPPGRHEAGLTARSPSPKCWACSTLS